MQVGKGRVMDEVEVDEELTARRRAQPGFIEASFPTIAGQHSSLGFLFNTFNIRYVSFVVRHMKA